MSSSYLFCPLCVIACFLRLLRLKNFELTPGYYSSKAISAIFLKETRDIYILNFASTCEVNHTDRGWAEEAVVILAPSKYIDKLKLASCANILPRKGKERQEIGN